jgi:hypothetical protein
MEAKTLLRLIKNDIAHLEEITCDFEIESLPSSDEVEVAFVHAKALLRELEILSKLTNRNENSFTALVSADETKGQIPEFDHPPQAQLKLLEIESQDIPLASPLEDTKADVPVDQEVPVSLGTSNIEKELSSDISGFKEELLPDKTFKAGKTLGETLGESHQMVNDILSQEKSESGFQVLPINSIWDGIGINDRFLFIRELFENNSEQFENAVTAIDNLNNIQNAVNYLKMNFKWHKTEASQKFLALVKRRFTN